MTTEQINAAAEDSAGGLRDRPDADSNYERSEHIAGFKSGVKWAAAALAAPIEVERGAEWVPVAERLPELREGIWSDNVLVVLENGTHTLAQLLSGSRWFLPFSGHAVFEANPVTHWMPLPAAPLKGGSHV